MNDFMRKEDTDIGRFRLLAVNLWLQKTLTNCFSSSTSEWDASLRH